MSQRARAGVPSLAKWRRHAGHLPTEWCLAMSVTWSLNSSFISSIRKVHYTRHTGRTKREVLRVPGPTSVMPDADPEGPGQSRPREACTRVRWPAAASQPLRHVAVFLCRRCLHHNRDLRVESVSRHRGQLPPTLHPQVREAEAVPAQLLQAHLLRAMHLRPPRVVQGRPVGMGHQETGEHRAPKDCPGAGPPPLFFLTIFSKLNFHIEPA